MHHRSKIQAIPDLAHHARLDLEHAMGTDGKLGLGADADRDLALRYAAQARLGGVGRQPKHAARGDGVDAEGDVVAADRHGVVRRSGEIWLGEGDC